MTSTGRFLWYFNKAASATSIERPIVLIIDRATQLINCIPKNAYCQQDYGNLLSQSKPHEQSICFVIPEQQHAVVSVDIFCQRLGLRLFRLYIVNHSVVYEAKNTYEL